jgi:hypothetical protein
MPALFFSLHCETGGDYSNASGSVNRQR